MLTSITVSKNTKKEPLVIIKNNTKFRTQEQRSSEHVAHGSKISRRSLSRERADVAQGNNIDYQHTINNQRYVPQNNQTLKHSNSYSSVERTSTSFQTSRVFKDSPTFNSEITKQQSLLTKPTAKLYKILEIFTVLLLYHCGIIVAGLLAIAIGLVTTLVHSAVTSTKTSTITTTSTTTGTTTTSTTSTSTTATTTSTSTSTTTTTTTTTTSTTSITTTTTSSTTSTTSTTTTVSTTTSSTTTTESTTSATSTTSTSTTTTTATTVIIPVPCVATAALTGVATLKTLSNGAISYTCFSVNWTASANSHTISFKFRQDSSDWYMDDVTIYDTSANQLIINGGFEGGSYGSANGHPRANNWTWSGSGCGCCMGVVSSNVKSGTYSWDDGCVGTTDNLSQSFSTTIGNIYFISWWLKNGGSGTASFNAAIT